MIKGIIAHFNDNKKARAATRVSDNLFFRTERENESKEKSRILLQQKFEIQSEYLTILHIYAKNNKLIIHENRSIMISESLHLRKSNKKMAKILLTTIFRTVEIHQSPLQ